MDELNPRTLMLAAIGDVAMNSADASWAMQTIAADVAGTDLLYFTLQDAPLGSQVKQVKNVVTASTTNRHIRHPAVDAEMRSVILSTLGVMERLVMFRNRIVHDTWQPKPSEDVPDALAGHRATRWSKSNVQSSRTSFHEVASLCFLVACTLGAAGDGIRSLRVHDREYVRSRRDDRIGKALSYHRQLTTRAEKLKEGTSEGWRWIESKAPI